MNAEELWKKFTADGRLEDYIEYRRHLEMQGELDLGTSDEIQRKSLGAPGNEYR